MCHDVGGQTIAHFLRKHFHEIPPQYKVPLDQRPQILTPEINLKIFQLNQEFHHKWKKISEILKVDIELDRNIVKNKGIELDNKINDYMNHTNK